MIRVPVRAGSASYEVLIGRDLLGRIGQFIAPLFRGKKCALIGDAAVCPLFGDRLTKSLGEAGYSCTVIEVPPGESSKSLARLEEIANAMARAGLDRSSFVIALGGGVLGDLAGFVASIFHRGIPYVNIPTTLLAQVDSSIGGKTAVNLPAGKNLVGSVHQPSLVISDVATLESLPPRELRQGLAEIIKHAVIADETLLDALKNELTELVRRNVEIKARFVGDDVEDRNGQRALLNFGHTVGHAIEAAADYKLLKHGECVSLGMIAACEISRRRAGFPAEQHARVAASLSASGLPTRLPQEISREKILAAMKHDKKFVNEEIRFVVTPRLGEACLSDDVTWEDIEGTLAKL